MSSCLSRPVRRSLPGLSLALVVPPGSAAQACLRGLLLRGFEGASAAAPALHPHPHHYALVAQVVAQVSAARVASV